MLLKFVENQQFILKELEQHKKQKFDLITVSGKIVQKDFLGLFVATKILDHRAGAANDLSGLPFLVVLALSDHFSQFGFAFDLVDGDLVLLAKGPD